MSNIHKFLLCIFVICAYTWVNDPGHVFTVDTSVSQSGVTFHADAYSTNPDNTPGHNIFNPGANLDTAQIDTQQELPNSGCERIDWAHGGENGGPITPYDANEDGFIDCSSDIELGA